MKNGTPSLKASSKVKSLPLRKGASTADQAKVVGHAKRGK